jgi:hypothetical protein
VKNVYLFSLGVFFAFHAGLQAQPFAFSKVDDAIGISHVYGNTNFMGGGTAWFDYNNDGWEDLYLAGGNLRDALYRNNGDGTFTEVGVAAGLNITNGFGTHAVTTGDYDRDGDRDVFLTTLNSWPNHLLRNNGDGTFTDVYLEAGFAGEVAWSASAAFGDYNLDGWLDLYVGNYVDNMAITYDSLGIVNGFAHDCRPNWLYVNNGDGTFTEVSGLLNAAADTGCVLAVSWSDFDRDQDVDMLIANDFGEFIVPNQLLRNNHPGAFDDASAATGANVGMYGMGIAVGDYDHDGDLDYYATNIGLNHLYINNGDGTFSDGTAAAGVEDIWVREGFYTVGWGTAFVDLDNDSWQELLVSNGHIPAAPFIRNDIYNPNRIFRNNADGTFTDVAEASGMNDVGVARGLACSDYDQDGDVDVVFGNIDSYYTPGEDKVAVYRNDLSGGGNWLGVKLVGVVNNLDAFGANVVINAGGQSWIDEVSGGSSHGSQNSSILHFGLGSTGIVDELTVYWPGGRTQVLEDVLPNQVITIIEDTAGIVDPVGLPGLSQGLGMQVRPNPVVNDTRISLELPAAVASAQVTVLDPAGRSVALVHDGALPAGRSDLRWDGADASGQRLVPGTYLVSVELGEGQRFVERVLVVR